MSPLIRGFFPINTTALHYQRLVESVDIEPQTQRANCNVICGFLSAWVSAPLTPVFRGQLYIWHIVGIFLTCNYLQERPG